MITSGVTKDIEVPGEPGVKITIRMLSHGALKKARDIRLGELTAMVGNLDLGALKDQTTSAEVKAAAEADPLNGLDVTTILRKGIRAWTYDEKVNSDNVDELDEDSAIHIATEIVKLSRRDKVQGEVLSETSPSGS